MPSNTMTDSDAEIRVSVGRYVQLLFVVGSSLTVFFFAASLINVILDGRRVDAWISECYGRILLAPWSIVVVIVVCDMFLGWRHPIWHVDDSGISIFATKRSRPRHIPWDDIASIRVFPCGVVALTTVGKPVHVSVIVAVPRDSSRWLRDFSASQLCKKTAEAVHPPRPPCRSVTN